MVAMAGEIVWKTRAMQVHEGVEIKYMFKSRVSNSSSDKRNFWRIWYTVITQRSYKLMSARHYSRRAST